MVWVQILVQLAIAVVLYVGSLLLAPKPAKRKPSEFDEAKTPTAREGIPVAYIVGTVLVTSPNVIAEADKFTNFYDR